MRYKNAKSKPDPTHIAIAPRVAEGLQGAGGRQEKMSTGWGLGEKNASEIKRYLILLMMLKLFGPTFCYQHNHIDIRHMNVFDGLENCEARITYVTKLLL